MNNAEMWSIVVGFVSATFVLPVIQQPRWSDRTRSLVTLGYSLLVGLVTVWVNGGLRGDAGSVSKSLTTSILLVLVSAISTYKGLAKPSGVAPAIEVATSK